MCVLQEATFERLLTRYERAFGEGPPLTVATLDEAIAFMRDRLATRIGADTSNCWSAISKMHDGLARAPYAGPAT